VNHPGQAKSREINYHADHAAIARSLVGVMAAFENSTFIDLPAPKAANQSPSTPP
jgi:hypothetical protein